MNIPPVFAPFRRFAATRRSSTPSAVLVGLLCVSSIATRAGDFKVTSPGFFYSINGQQPNPTLTLVRGETYTFDVSSSSIHPFKLLVPDGTTTGNNTSSGTITFKVPETVIDYRYECSNHHFGNTITTVAAPVPVVLGVVAGDKLVVRSSGSAPFVPHPEFTSSLTDPNWQALAVESSTTVDGVVESTCTRPAGDVVFVRIRATRD